MGKKVLIVDDSQTDLSSLSGFMQSGGYEVIEARNGEEALEKAKSEKPDVILMDVIMPGINGYQACRELTRDKETSKIPVVIVTNRGADTDKAWGMRQGAKAYLVKPVTKEFLLKAVHGALAGA